MITKLRISGLFLLLTLLCPQTPLLAKKITCLITAIEKEQITLACGLENGVSVGDQGSVFYQIKIGAMKRTVTPATFTIVNATPKESTAQITKTTGELKISYSAEVDVREQAAPTSTAPSTPAKMLPSPEMASEAIAVMERANALSLSGKLEEAKAEYEKVLSLVPDDPLARARLLEIEKKITEQKLVRAQIDYYNARANSAASQGEFFLAKEYAAKALALDPVNSVAAQLFLTANQKIRDTIYLQELPKRSAPSLALRAIDWSKIAPPPPPLEVASIPKPAVTSPPVLVHVQPAWRESVEKAVSQSPSQTGTTGPQETPTVHISAADFKMGEGRRGAKFRNEMPEHLVHVNDYSIDPYEVTVHEYQLFVEATHHAPPANWPNGAFPANRAEHPVTGVSWYDAETYCNYLGKRLPTEAEWEFAGRGPSGWTYPWGNNFEPRMTNTVESNVGVTVPVTANPNDQSPFGVMDLGGNVSEWVADWYQPYPQNNFPEVDYGQRSKVVRGGSFESQSVFSRNGFRGYRDPKSPAEDIGFRCAQSPSAGWSRSDRLIPTSSAPKTKKAPISRSFLPPSFSQSFDSGFWPPASGFRLYRPNRLNRLGRLFFQTGFPFCALCVASS